MTSYLRSWLYSGTPALESDNSIPIIERISPPPDADDDDDGDETETERNDDEDDRPPSFPAMNSAQRAQGSQFKSAALTDSQLMPPPPLPSPGLRKQPGPTSRANNINININNDTLAVPPRTLKPPTKLSTTKKREKVALAPGFGPLDWAALKSSGKDLRGVDTLMRIPPSVLKQHNKPDDSWSAFNGKVYNITPYLKYHPGGEKELMRVAGRDGTKLFALTHAWVNIEFMLDACLVGFLVPEPSSW